MKKLFLAAIAVAALSSQAFAFERPASPHEFDVVYSKMVDVARAGGLPVTRSCFSNYCANSIAITNEQNGILLANLQFSDGLNLQEICMGDSRVRRCYRSDGRVWDEQYSNSSWSAIKVWAENYP